MAQEFQNMKTTHSWINLITPAPVQVLYFAFGASTDDLRSPQNDGGEHGPFKNIPDLSHFIFEIIVGNSRIRHRTTLNLNIVINRF